MIFAFCHVYKYVLSLYTICEQNENKFIQAIIMEAQYDLTLSTYNNSKQQQQTANFPS